VIPKSKIGRIEKVLTQKLRDPRSIFLLGAGTSFCAGLPGVLGLTELIHTKLRGTTRATFEEILSFLIDNGIDNPNIEEILSELFHRLNTLDLPTKERIRLTELFEKAYLLIKDALLIDAPTEFHNEFMKRVVCRRKAEPAKKAPLVQIFTTNYDLLIELSCEALGIIAINGFEGIFKRRWNPACFDQDIGKATDHAKTPRFEPSARHIRLYKLHGSLSWYKQNGEFYENPNLTPDKIPLIIYPSRLKYAESIRPPFDWLFRKFSSAIYQANLLICIGYRFADAHINQLIFSGLDNGLSLLALSKGPIKVLSERSTHPHVSILNEHTSVIDGITLNSISELWAFEKFACWFPALKEDK
jgi:hypothetical protein